MGDVPLVPSSPSIQRAPRVISTSGWSASPQLWSNILGLVESADSSADSDESCSEPPRKKQRLTPEISIPHGDKGLIPVATFDFQVETNYENAPWVRETLKKIHDKPVAIRLGPLTYHKSEDDLQGCHTLRLHDACNGRLLESISFGDHEPMIASVLEPIISRHNKIPKIRSAKTHPDYLAAIHDEPLIPILSFRLSPRGTDDFILRVELAWRNGQSYLDLVKNRFDKECARLLEKLFPDGPRSGTHSSWSPEDFYETVHVPPADMELFPRLQQDILDCSLYPFQKRTVQFLLNREGAVYESGRIVTRPQSHQHVPFSFRKEVSGHNRGIYVSHALGTVVDDITTTSKYTMDIQGGILAEEMGLGKTVELIALMRLHQRFMPKSLCQIMDPYTGRMVLPSKATLIVTPGHLLQQWKDELALHAPKLRVYHYRGINPYQKEQADGGAEHLLQFDVVLLTYPVLGKEIYYAEAQPQRNLRGAKKYVPPRSPLIDVSWWRVCLDEAQMVENGLSHSATVARLIPRVNVWAVSGTPFKNHVQDLLGLLSFLRLSPFSDKKVWQRVDKESFSQIFSTIAIRHTKEKVRHELRLPPQKRVVITVPFTAIEEQNYSTLFQTMCQECGLNADGSPNSDDFDPQSPEIIGKMKAWLRRLRQTCLHPQVGGRNRRALGRSNAPLRTVAEVLQVMIDSNEASIRHEERQSLLAQVLRGHIIAFNKSDPNRSKQALEIYSAALKEADVHVDKRRKELAAAKLEAEVEKHDPEQKDAPTTTRNIRSELELQHICTFFVATAYYLIKEDVASTEKDSEEYRRLEELETTHYDKAKVIRKEMLSESLAKAEGSMQEIRELQLKEIKDVPMPKYTAGIENRKFMEKFHEVADILNKQAVHLRDWRRKVYDILLKPLVDTDKEEEQTGIEYEDSTKVQDELYVLFQVLRTYAADRHGVITGQLNTLSEYEAKEALRQAKAGEGHAPELLIEYMADWPKLRAKPENGSLRGIIVDFRSLVSNLEWRTDERDMEGMRARAELGIVEPQINHLQKISTSLVKGLVDLEKELDFFRNCMNHRLEYYRQLQSISDTVRPYKEELDETLDEVELERTAKKLEGSQNRLAAHQTKRRFLMHLRSESSQDEQRICVICQSTFENGVLTVCGHLYCTECIKLWLLHHRTCPVCKKHLRTLDFQEITYKPRDIRAEEEHHHPDSPTSSRGTSGSTSVTGTPGRSTPSVPTSIYAEISTSTLNQIKSIDLPSSYGTKIDTLARHIIWLREADPGAKSIVFSQYTDFLTVLSDALHALKIGSASIQQSNGIDKFRHDPSIECFLLDAKSDSSGLNLVCATHVFLCEPLVNPAIELQAIARVHRIGQMRATTVWMEIIADSVEEAVYELSVGRRLAHVAKQHSKEPKANSNETVSGSELDEASKVGLSKSDAAAVQESALDVANSLELQRAPISRLLVRGTKGGGEVVDTDDMWKCLFGKPRARRIEENGGVSGALRAEVDRQLRAEAAEERMIAGQAGAGAERS